MREWLDHLSLISRTRHIFVGSIHPKFCLDKMEKRPDGGPDMINIGIGRRRSIAALTIGFVLSTHVIHKPTKDIDIYLTQCYVAGVIDRVRQSPFARFKGSVREPVRSPGYQVAINGLL